MKKITLSCCNTANPDRDNIAEAFIKRMNVKTVVGFDGGAYFDYKKKKLTAGQGRQHTWNKYVQHSYQYVGRAWPFGTPIYEWKPIRERMGKRTYRNGAWSSLKYVDKRFYQYA